MDKEILKSHNDLNIFRWQISLFLCPPFQSQPIGHRNGTGVCLAAVATVGIFGGSFAVKKFNSCGIRGVFGVYLDETQAKVVKIRRPLYYEDVLMHTFGQIFPLLRWKIFSHQKRTGRNECNSGRKLSTQNRN